MLHVNRYQSGVTLVELVISIVIITVAASSVMLVILQTTGVSADPIIKQQAVAAAQAYMEEILMQAFVDPQGGETGGAEAGESRGNFDDILDYDGLNDTSGAVNHYGNAVPGLASYNIAVTVSDDTLNGDAAKRIDVTVTHDGDADLNIPIRALRIF